MKKYRNILWGIAFILIGIVWGLDATGIIDFNFFFDGWWTLFIIIPCTIGLFTEKDKMSNLIGLLIGVALLLCYRNILSIDLIWKLILPTLLIMIGIKFILKDVNGEKENKNIEIVEKRDIEE